MKDQEKYRWSGYCTRKGWDHGKIKDLNIRLFNWDRNAFGDHFAVVWIEEDPGFKSSLDVGKDTMFHITIDVSSGDKKVGELCYSFKDPAIKSTQYSMGDVFRFWIKLAPFN